MSDDELGKLAARSAQLRRQLVTEPAPKSEPAPMSWLGEVAPDMVARFRAAEADALEHAASCTARPCERCERYVCACGSHVDGSTQCRACSSKELLLSTLKPTVDSVPARFQWAINTSAEMLVTRTKVARSWIEKGLTAPPSKNLLFTGDTGAGKTSLAVAMLAAWVKVEPSRRKGALFVEAAWLSRARARHRLGQGEAELVERCLAAPLLLVDDLGQEREDRDGCITDVVYGRSAADLPTWVTCGLPGGTLDDFAKLLGQRYDGGFVRRILETGTIVPMGAR